ncbi:FadR family transcriptional regulator [Micrococcales bacterium 31B]|nr:FadR family transcriptional regulator [Micrococcales bacterium 31B]
MPFEHCVEQLGTAIKFGILRPGTQLPGERDLAAQMGVSRATVREAITALRTAGLVSTQRGRGGGTTVLEAANPAPGASALTATRETGPEATPDLEADVRDLLTFREATEPGYARVAAACETTADEAEWLRAALRATQQAATPSEYRAADARFHLTIARLTGSPRVVSTATDTLQQVHRLLDRIPFLPTNIDHAQSEHESLVEAIIAGNAREAHDVMTQHCAATAALIRGLAPRPDQTADPHAGRPTAKEPTHG